MSNFNYFNNVQNLEVDEAVLESALYAREVNANLPSVAIGPGSGEINQGSNAIAIGFDAGEFNQGFAGIAIGDSAGYTGQNDFAVAIGFGAGVYDQGTGAIAIGAYAGQSGQAPGSIVLNAASDLLFPGDTSYQTVKGLFVNPVRSSADGLTTQALWYNSVTCEICYGTLSAPPEDL
jgi:hypothetical protein